MLDKDKDIVLVGYSGHGFVVADAAFNQGLDVKFYTDKSENKHNPYDLKYLGFEDSDEYKWDENLAYILGVGDNGIRRKTAELIQQQNGKILKVSHPSAFVSGQAKIGIGVFISANAAVNAFAVVEDFCIINTGAIVEHECFLSSAVHIAPGALLAGGVHVGDESFIGANAVIKEGVRIGKNVTVGAGAVVLHDIEDDQKVVGNPGRLIL